MIGGGRKISPTMRRRGTQDKSSRYVHTELDRRATAAPVCQTGCNAALLLARSRAKLINGEIGARSALNERRMYICIVARAFFLFLLLFFLSSSSSSFSSLFGSVPSFSLCLCFSCFIVHEVIEIQQFRQKTAIVYVHLHTCIEETGTK